MFEEEDFILPLEKQLRLRVIETEIDECSDVEALRENLKTCASSLMKYQHITAKLAERSLRGFMTDFLSTMGLNANEQSDGSN